MPLELLVDSEYLLWLLFLASTVADSVFLCGASSFSGPTVETRPIDVDPWHMAAACPRGRRAKVPPRSTACSAKGKKSKFEARQSRKNRKSRHRSITE